MGGVEVTVVGKYIELTDAYKSIYEALTHAGITHNAKVEFRKVSSEELEKEGAEKLLDEAGYPRGADGTRFKTTLNHGSFASVDYAEIAAAYWAEIGVEVEIDVLSGAEYHERLFGRSGEGMYSAIAGTLYDPTQSGGW